MPRGRGGKRSGGPWYGEFRERLLFEADARSMIPDLRNGFAKQVQGAGYRLYFTVEVPHYGRRKVEVHFPKIAPRWARVFVDGRKDSPHRYRGGSLCMWEPEDPPQQRWVFEDGLAALVAHITIHLFKEGWWRETGEWLGAEVLHAPGVKQESVE